MSINVVQLSLPTSTAIDSIYFFFLFFLVVVHINPIFPDTVRGKYITLFGPSTLLERTWRLTSDWSLRSGLLIQIPRNRGA